MVSYDHGDSDLMVAPAECSKTITVNPETGEVLLDVNTVAVVPVQPLLVMLNPLLKAMS